MKLITILLLTLAVGNVQAFPVPPISVGMDNDLLTQTPIPIPKLTATFTFTPTPTFTSTATSTPTVTPTPVIKYEDNFLPPSSESITQFNHESHVVATIEPTIETKMDEGFKEQGFFEAGLGMGLPVKGWSPLFTSGTGAKAGLGILFKDGLAIELDLEAFGYSNADNTGAISENEVLVLPTIRHFIASGNIRPYVSMGDGLAINSFTSSAQNSTVENFALSLGAGVEFQFENAFSTYLEGKYNFIFSGSSPAQDIPVFVGGRFGL